jgi:hypothetical protein
MVIICLTLLTTIITTTYHRQEYFALAQLNLVPISNLPEISTRGHFNIANGELNQPMHSKNDYSTSGIIINSCFIFGKEVAIYIHGVWASEVAAKEQVDRVR